MLTLLFDGIAYGMLLFVLAVGLAVTLGLMNFVNLAHGAFAMAGGYVTVLLMDRAGVPFLATLPLAFLLPALVGAVAERLLYRPMYKRPHLDHVLFSIGLVFMTVAAVDWLVGSQQQIVKLPLWLQGRFEIASVGIGKYRLFIIVVCLLLTLMLQWVLGLDPSFPLKFMIYFLIVVSVGGTTTITGPLLAALLLGIADVMGKYYVPQLGAFVVYLLMVIILFVRPQGLFGRGATR